MKGMKGGMRSEAITDQSDIKTGVAAVAPPEEEEADWGMKILQLQKGGKETEKNVLIYKN